MYGEYIFTLGTENERTYKGGRLRILEGMEFAARVVKELAKVLSAPNKDFNLESIQSDGQGTKALSFLLQCLSEVDSDAYMGFFKTLLAKTIVEARAPSEQGIKYICREAELNDWFTKFPSDLFPFSFKVIMENVTPFLPEEGQKVIKTFMDALVKKQ